MSEPDKPVHASCTGRTTSRKDIGRFSKPFAEPTTRTEIGRLGIVAHTANQLSQSNREGDIAIGVKGVAEPPK